MKPILSCLLPAIGAAVFLPAAQADCPPACVCAAQANLSGPPAFVAIMADDPVPGPQTVAFLGVETEQASATLTEQLGLPENTGLVVEQVVPNSAAASALKRHDILLKLDDQLLVDPRQLAVLVHTHKQGDTVVVTYLRAGRQETASVKLGRHEAPKVAEWGSGDEPPFPLQGNGPDGENMREDMNRVLSLMNGKAPWPLGPGAPVPPDAPQPPGPPSMHEESVDMANSNIVYTDDKGTLTLSVKDGKRSLVAVDAHGQPLFSGPIDTPEECRAMPPEVVGWLKGLHGLREFRFITGRDFQGGQTRVLQPEGQRLPLPPQRDQPPQPPF
jgi:hypothetical protein